MTLRKIRSESGFTIIELMIATAVLSTLILTSTIIIIDIGHLYYKGVTQAQLQDDVRNISEDVSQQLKLSGAFTTDGSNTPGIPHSLCIEGARYSYITNVQLSSTQPHILWKDNIPTGGGICTPANLTLAQPSLGGTEMATNLSTLTAFSVSGLSTESSHTITVGMAYGDP